MIMVTDPTSRQCASYRTLAIAAFLCMLLLIAGASAKPIPITGPTVITSPGQYYIASSVTNSTDPVYIEVRASNVYIDGRGKVIDGTDADESIGIKIYNSAMSLVNVVVKNVVLNDWSTGMWLTDVKNSLIDKVTVSSSSGNGILLQNSRGNTIQNSVLQDNGNCGIILFENSNSNTLQKNTIQTNGIDGIRIRFSDNNLVQNSKILNNIGPGINLDEGNYNTLLKNTITGNGGWGIVLYKASDNQITQNTVKNNFNGILLNTESFNNDLYQNTVTCSTYNGFYLNTGSDDNVIRGNTVDNNLYGLVIRQADANVFYDNKVRNNGQVGVWLWDSNHNVLYNNYFYNINNTNLIGTSSNTWNLTLSEQKSITGGKFSGGNSWGQPNGQGFSQVTPDSNRDGICDNSFLMAVNNVDWLPLKYKKV
jgi:parallel beta-helix repeat protein